MQHYIIFGLGFSAEVLTDEEFSYIDNQEKSEDGLHIEPFTETDYFEKTWSTIVIKRMNEIPHRGKMATFNQIKKALSKEVIIDAPTKEFILKELKKYNIEHHYDKVEPIIFSSCY